MSQHRGVVVAQNGVVAASQPLAVSAGLGVLKQGGSFADAAIATSAVLAVTEPYASHLGGDAFLIVYDGATGRTTALNGSGIAPRATTADRFPGGIPPLGLASAAIPGLVDAWDAMHKRWGTRPLADLLAPAIDYAENGFPAGFRCAQAFAAYAAEPGFDRSAAQALLAEGRLPTPGAIVRQPDLAWTLRQIADGGRDAFYEGLVAERFLRFSRDNGGLFAAADFTAHRTQVCEPIRTTYRGFTVHGQPPVSQGHILLQELNLVEGFDLASMGANSAEAIHVQVEAKKLAFADRAAYLGDPEFTQMPLDILLSKEYAASRRGQIDLLRANPQPAAGHIQRHTTYFCVADRGGSAVSFIQSVFARFGCGIVAEGTGVLFNNRMRGFSLDPSSPNHLQPGKRTAHTLNAYLVTADTADGSGKSRLAWVGGTPGADVQVQSNLQVLCNVIDFDMNPQEAVEAARWQHGESVRQSDAGLEPVLQVENRIPLPVRQGLEQRGHCVEAIGPWAHGSAYQLLAIHPDNGVYMAGSDPRCDGHAAGY